jgi:hypothetical protein
MLWRDGHTLKKLGSLGEPHHKHARWGLLKQWPQKNKAQDMDIDHCQMSNPQRSELYEEKISTER